jgi:uncharacterized membrane protein
LRYASIDILRTLAIVVMVIVHFGENLSGYTVPFAGFGAPVFAFLSGVGYCLWAHGQKLRGKTESEISKTSVRRGLFVFGVGFAFNVLVWLPEDIYNWDVLTLIGAALLLLNVMRKLPLSISVLVGTIAVVVSPALRLMAEYDLYWSNGYFDGDLTLTDVTIGFFATGYFPFLPWIAFSLAGFVTATRMFTEPTPSTRFRPALIGAGFIVASVAALALRPMLPETGVARMLGGWTMFPPTTEYVFGTLGIAMLLLGLMHRFIDRSPSAMSHTRALSVVTVLSRNSFTIYLLHHIVHLWPMWIYGYATGHETTHFWRQATSTSTAMVLACVFIVLCYFVLRRVGRDRRFGIESWMRWLCD